MPRQFCKTHFSNTRFSALCISMKPPIRTGGGYSDLVFLSHPFQGCLPSFWLAPQIKDLLSRLAFLPLCGKKHKNSRQFRLSKEFLLLSRNIFDLQKYFCCFPGVFSGFKSAFAASPMRFRASKILSLLSRRVFMLQKYFRSCLCVFLGFKITFAGHFGLFSAFKSTFFNSVQTKINTLRSFYGKSNESYQQRARDGA